MKRIACLIGVTAALASAPFMLGQEKHPFYNHSDTGEIIHVLPPQAALRSPHDTAPTIAPSIGQSAVYPASYGAGNLFNHGGPQMTGAGVGFRAIYWNSTVANANQTSLGYADIKTQIDAFVDSFANGQTFSSTAPKSDDDYAVIQQYGTSKTPILSTLQRYGYFVDNQPTQNSITDSKIRQYLQGLFQSGQVQLYDNVVYGVYFPPGMKISSGGMSCSSFCGYHGAFSYRGFAVKYAVFPYLNCSGCSISGFSVADMLTIVTSHEIREAITDPQLNSWYDAAGYEADDKCVWHNLYQTTSGFWVQPEYSNAPITINGVAKPGCFVAR